jgi:hypothetical protein
MSIEHMDELLNSAAVMRIAATTDIAGVVYRLNPADREHLSILGWNGTKPVFTIAHATALAFAAALEAQPLPLLEVGERATLQLHLQRRLRWLRAERRGRIYMVHARGAQLINLTDHGFELEPGAQVEHAD